MELDYGLSDYMHVMVITVNPGTPLSLQLDREMPWLACKLKVAIPDRYRRLITFSHRGSIELDYGLSDYMHVTVITVNPGTPLSLQLDREMPWLACKLKVAIPDRYRRLITFSHRGSMELDYGSSDYMHITVITVNRFSKDFSSERMWWSLKGQRFVFGGVVASIFTMSSQFCHGCLRYPWCGRNCLFRMSSWCMRGWWCSW